MKWTSQILLALIILSIGACSYTQKIKDGETAFDRKQYAVAVTMLEDEYNKSSNDKQKARKAYYAAISYKRMGNVKASLPWFRRAYEANFGDEALYEYSKALREDQQYENAATLAEELLRNEPGNTSYRVLYSSCIQAIDWMEEAKDRSEYLIEESEFNSAYDDYAATYYENGTLVFTSDRPGQGGGDNYHWTGRHYGDFYILNQDSDELSRFPKVINSKHYEGTLCFDQSMSKMYFTRCFGEEGQDRYCQIMVTEKIGNSWTEPERLNIMPEEVNYMHPVLSEDGNSLIFSALNDDDGITGYDLYQVDLIKGQWSEPVKLSSRINTQGNEMFPFVHADTIYFSSDYLSGMGGLDIFKVWKRDDGSYSSAQNMKPPINSGADDFAWIVDKKYQSDGTVLQQGYFSSSRQGGAGNDDLYRYQHIYLEPTEEELEEKDKEIEYTLVLEGKVTTPKYEDPEDPNSELIGVNTLANASVSVLFGDSVIYLQTDRKGMFFLDLEWEQRYKFVGSYPEYFVKEKELSTFVFEKDPENPSTVVLLELRLDKIYKNKEIVLKNIYYDFNKWDIRTDAQPTLDTLSDLLRTNPKISIELASHTDCRGEDVYNEDLSQKRAQSAVDYLISNGIDPKRLTAKGYGEYQPSVDCACEDCTEDEHQQNRRTTFKVID